MAVNPAFIPKELTDVYAPDNYDSNCTILACNFPTGTSVEECSNFMSWIGPVVYVEEGPSLQRETNFLVVYSTPEFAVRATQEELVFNEGCRVYCRFVDAKPTVWGNITNFFQGIDQQYGASDQISSFINDTAGMFLLKNINSKQELGLVLDIIFKLGFETQFKKPDLLFFFFFCYSKTNPFLNIYIGLFICECDLFHP